VAFVRLARTEGINLLQLVPNRIALGTLSVAIYWESNHSKEGKNMNDARNYAVSSPTQRVSAAEVLVAEYKDHETATAAAALLCPQGIEMGDVRVHGAEWLGSTEPGGTKTLPQVCAMGSGRGAIGFGIAGFIIGIAGWWPIGMTDQSSLHALLMTLAGAAFGAVLGTAVGAIFWGLIHKDAVPNWVEPQYGDHLRGGVKLLIVSGTLAVLDLARQTLNSTEYLTLEIRRLELP
jgi:hypothetical protein